MTPSSTFRLFVYDSLLSGEPEHSFLAAGEFRGPALTEPKFHLVELQGFGALVLDGQSSVTGEVYEVDLKTRTQLDLRRQVPVLFSRSRITLMDGTTAEAYLMTADQVRGRRRIHHGDWKGRFQPRAGRDLTRPIVAWARSRSSKS